MTEELDLKGVIEQLQHENEQLRLQMVKEYNKRSPDFLKLLAFIQEHYIAFLIMAMWLALIISFIDILQSRRDTDHA